MLRRSFVGLGAAACALAALPFAAPALAQDYPDRPITLIVPWGAGGGTDATARIIGAVLEGELGQPISVVNRTGGSGVVGHSGIAEAEPDGYTIGIATVEIGMMHWQGLTDLTWENYTPLALMNYDPAGVQVRSDSPYDTLEDLLTAIEESPAGTFKASGTGQGGIWHVALARHPDDIRDRLITALENVYNSDQYQEFMAAQGYGIRWASGDEFAEFMDASNVSFGETMRAVGLVQ